MKRTYDVAADVNSSKA